MKESHYKTVTIEKETSYTHTCNNCGKGVNIKSDTSEEWTDDIKNFHVDFGYESHFDGEKWSFDLCEECLVNLIKQFKHVPDGFKLDGYSDLSQEQHQQLFEDWKVDGTWDELKFKTYEELVEFSQLYNKEYINELIEKYHPGKPLLQFEDD